MGMNGGGMKRCKVCGEGYVVDGDSTCDECMGDTQSMEYRKSVKGFRDQKRHNRVYNRD